MRNGVCLLGSSVSHWQQLENEKLGHRKGSDLDLRLARMSAEADLFFALTLHCYWMIRVRQSRVE